MDTNALTQQRFFEYLSSIIPPNVSLVTVLCDALEVTEASAYRRIKGETPLKFDELVSLCSKYAVSIDQFVYGIPHNGMVPFRMLGIKQSPPDISGYLNSLLTILKSYRGGTNYIYAAKDVPVFHLFQYPELTAFKIFFWKKSNFDDASLRNKRFHLQEALQDFAPEIALAREIAGVYAQFPVIEIWNLETTSSYYKQLSYYLQAHLFERPEDASTLCDQLSEMYAHIQEEAAAGFKTMPGNPQALGKYQLYKNDLVVIDNAIHIQFEGKSTVFNTFNLISYLATEDPFFCDEVHQWLIRLISKSDSISQHAEKERFRFFSEVLKRSEAIQREVLAQLG